MVQLRLLFRNGTHWYRAVDCDPAFVTIYASHRMDDGAAGSRITRYHGRAAAIARCRRTCAAPDPNLILILGRSRSNCPNETLMRIAMVSYGLPVEGRK